MAKTGRISFQGTLGAYSHQAALEAFPALESLPCATFEGAIAAVKGGRAGPADTITTFVFRVRSIQAALYKALGGFATNGVNMVKLESYMLDGHFAVVQFYADVEGHPGLPARAGGSVLSAAGGSPRPGPHRRSSWPNVLGGAPNPPSPRRA